MRRIIGLIKKWVHYNYLISVKGESYMNPRTNIRWEIMLLLLFIISSVCSCGGEGGDGSSSTSGTPPSSNYVPRTVVSRSITPVNPVIPVGLDQQFKATQTWSDGSTEEIDINYFWKSSNTSVATIDDLVILPEGGFAVIATAVAPGTTTITVEPSSNAAASTTLTVSSATLSSILITPDQASWPAGFTQQFKAMGTYSDGRTYDITKKVRWGSSDISKVAVDSSKGLATTLKAGTSTIMATMVLGGISGSTTLTVSSATLSSILITPVNPVIPVGLDQQFKATGTYSDGASYDITNMVTWSSSDTSKVTVSPLGLATNRKIAGTTTITATRGGISGSTVLTAQGVVQTGLSASVNWPQGFSGWTTCQATATASYSDGTTQDVTTQVTWSAKSSSVSVTQGGKVTISGAGPAAVQATMGTFSAVASAYYY